MNTDTFIELSRKALYEDNEEILSYLEELAVKSSNSKKNRLYREIMSLLDEYRSINQNAVMTFSDGSDADDVWLNSPIAEKIDQFLAVHNDKHIPANLKLRYKRILLYGPPGTGKTTLGYHIASRLNKPVDYIKVSDVISSRFGETTRNIAKVFDKPGEAVIFIDEFDAFAKSRYDNNDVGELKRIVNSLIQTLDFSHSEKIVLVSTNLVDSIDPAILRRFPIKIEVPKLTRNELQSFMRFTLSRVNAELPPDDIKYLAEIFSLLDLKTVDEVRSILEQSIVSNRVAKRSNFSVEDVLSTALLNGYIKKDKIKKLRDDTPEQFTSFTNALKRIFSQTDLAPLYGMHRNSIGNHYGKKV